MSAPKLPGGLPAMLVPTEGCYQKPIPCRIVGETKTQFRVMKGGEPWARKFRKRDMLHVSPHDRHFPNYRLVLQNDAQSAPAADSEAVALVRKLRDALDARHNQRDYAFLDHASLLKEAEAFLAREGK